MMGEAIRRAASDAGLTSVPNPDALRVVSLLSWKYGNPARFIADDLGLTPRESLAFGGNVGAATVLAQVMIDCASNDSTQSGHENLYEMVSIVTDGVISHHEKVHKKA